MMILLQISVYASYLYDAVQLYAAGLDAVLSAGGRADDGEAIIDNIRGQSYESQYTTTGLSSIYDDIIIRLQC